MVQSDPYILQSTIIDGTRRLSIMSVERLAKYVLTSNSMKIAALSSVGVNELLTNAVAFSIDQRLSFRLMLSMYWLTGDESASPPYGLVLHSVTSGNV